MLCERDSRRENIMDAAVKTQSLVNRYPDELKDLCPYLKELKEGSFTEETLLFMRDIIRKAVSKDEQKMLRRRDEYLDAVKALSDLSAGLYGEREYHFNDTNDFNTEAFSFYAGDGYYCLKLPKLNVKTEKNHASRSENMIGRYIKDAVRKSLELYQAGGKRYEIFDRFTIVFVHFFSPENGDRYDTDNIEIKKAIDSINGILIENDTIKRSHIYQLTAEAGEEFTLMYVIKGHALSDVIASNLERLELGSIVVKN